MHSGHAHVHAYVHACMSLLCAKIILPSIAYSMFLIEKSTSMCIKMQVQVVVDQQPLVTIDCFY
jgi:hypothetical protein